MRIGKLNILCAWIPVILVFSCTGGSQPAAENRAANFNIEKPQFPERDFLITDYGALNDGVNLNTEAINKTIQECSNAGGGRVVIPAGVWITGAIRLMSNVNLHAEEGAIVLFSKNFDLYPFVFSYFEGRPDYRAMPLLFGDSLTNVAITGKGIFDGSGGAWRPVKKEKLTEGEWRSLVRSGGVLDQSGRMWWPNEYALEAAMNPQKIRQEYGGTPEMDRYKAYFRPPLIQLVSCDRVLLEGPVFENSPGWCIHPLMCTNLTVNEITVRNPWYAQNGDGIDLESCKYVSITNSTFDVGDDAICLKSGRDEEGRERGMPTQYVEVDNCIVHHGHGGFVVGSEMSGGVKDVWVRNCSFTGTDVGLRFKSTRGRGGVVENIHIENIRMVDIARDAIIFNLFYAGLAPTEMDEDPIESLISNAPPVSEETPEFRNITISGVNCQGAERALQILGLPEMPVEGLRLENSVFTSKIGVNCLFASNLSINEVIVNTDGHPSMSLVNVMGAEIGAFNGNNKTRYYVDGKNTSGIMIRTADTDEARGMTSTGDKLPEGALDYREL